MKPTIEQVEMLERFSKDASRLLHSGRKALRALLDDYYAKGNALRRIQAANVNEFGGTADLAVERILKELGQP